MSQRAETSERAPGPELDVCEMLARQWLENDLCETTGAVSAVPTVERVASLARLLRAEQSRARRAIREEMRQLFSKLYDNEPVIEPDPPRPPHDLQEEWETYKRLRPSLLLTDEDRHVLIKGHEVLGIFDDFDVAYRAGLERLGNVPMLIHKVVAAEVVQYG
jgi:hypothetical protein